MDILTLFRDLFEWLGPLRGKRNPIVAAIIGFASGGVGLGIYFRSLKDFLITAVIFILMIPVLKEFGEAVYFAAGIIFAAWGYFRTLSSNRMLDQKAASNVESVKQSTRSVKQRKPV